jgi:hypothetical protein
MFCLLDEVVPIYASTPRQHNGLGMNGIALSIPFSAGGTVLMVVAIFLYPAAQRRIGCRRCAISISSLKHHHIGGELTVAALIQQFTFDKQSRLPAYLCVGQGAKYQIWGEQLLYAGACRLGFSSLCFHVVSFPPAHLLTAAAEKLHTSPSR